MSNQIRRDDRGQKGAIAETVSAQIIQDYVQNEERAHVNPIPTRLKIINASSRLFIRLNTLI